MALTIDKNLCPQNHRCPLIAICHTQAITQQGYELPKIDAEKCIECEQCVKYCGKKAVCKSLVNGEIM